MTHPRDDSPGKWGRRGRAAAFWISLLLAIGAMVTGFRYHPAPAELCATTLMQDMGDEVYMPVELPQRINPAANSRNVLRYRFAFQLGAHDLAPQAISIGEGLPFYRLQVNGADLTPTADLAARNLRDIGPHLHMLPADVLRHGTNIVELELPSAISLGEVRIDQVCVGNVARLEPGYRANWWKMVGLPRIFTMVFCVLIVLAAALSALSPGQSAYRWYVACLLLMLGRIAYVSTAARPGTPLLWVELEAISLVLLPYALYQFMSAYWQFSLRWLKRLMLALTGTAAGSSIYLYLVPLSDFSQMVSALFSLCVIVNSLLVIVAMVSQLHALHSLEKHMVLWTTLFSFACSCLEIANFLMPLTGRWTWAGPPGTTLLALGLGYLLIRRMALGAGVFAYAADVLASDLDHALGSHDPKSLPLTSTTASSVSVWADVSASITRRERGRMLRDIHDGFGSRLVAVLMQARREFPHSPVQRQIQRALLDMRLMMDVMDESSRALVLALAKLRHRIEPSLEAAGIVSQWHTVSIEHVILDDRRKLMSVFRCLEEMLNNTLQHSGAKRVVVDVAIVGWQICFSVQDDGCGAQTSLPTDIDGPEAGGLMQAALRARAIGGSLCIGPAAEQQGTTCVLTVPLF